jgi:apolipoprotein N-acyltransferase
MAAQGAALARPVLATLAGLAHAAALALPGTGQPLWWLQLASMAALVALLPTLPVAGQARRPVLWQAALTGWLFATAWLAGTFWWLFVSLHTYGGLAAPLAVLAVWALAAFLALYYALACMAFVALGRTGAAQPAIVFVASWTLAELARDSWFTGFPWGAAGYAHVDGPLAALAPWVGVYGMTALAAGLAAGLARMVRPTGASRRAGLLPLSAGAALVVLANTLPLGADGQGGDRVRNAMGQPVPALAVTLLQGNIPQDEKFQPGTGVPLALEWYGQQLDSARAALVVAPETALPLLPQQLPPGYWDALLARYAAGTQAALIGLPLGSLQEGYSNSAVGLKPGAAQAYRYDKHHLVPFGEFIPPLFRWFTNLLNIPLGDFGRGDVGQPSFEWAGQRLAPNICYEDLFGDELAARFRDPAQAPTVFVNLSNIGWFGDTLAIDQHLQISRMRALEFARPMLRATNTGATVMIDHRGRVTASLPRHTRGVLTVEVEGRTGITPFAWWASRWGLWPLWLLGAGVVAAAAWLRRRSA